MGAGRSGAGKPLEHISAVVYNICLVLKPLEAICAAICNIFGFTLRIECLRTSRVPEIGEKSSLSRCEIDPKSVLPHNARFKGRLFRSRNHVSASICELKASSEFASRVSLRVQGVSVGLLFMTG
jgi:hypothetical protein